MQSLKVSLLFICLFAVSHVASAQKLERYCELRAASAFLSNKVTITVDYGEKTSYWKDNRLKDDEGYIKRFNSVADAMNYLGTQGWKLVSAMPFGSSSSDRVVIMYFKKEYDPSELSPAGSDK